MKAFIIALLALLVSMPAMADNELTAPSLKVYPDIGCATSDFAYVGEIRLNFSNSNNGTVQFKCKMDLVSGDPQYYYYESGPSDYPLSALGYPGAECYSTVSIEGNRGTWMALCSGAWESE